MAVALWGQWKELGFLQGSQGIRGGEMVVVVEMFFIVVVVKVAFVWLGSCGGSSCGRSGDRIVAVVIAALQQQ